MEFKLVEVTGLAQAYAALKESKRNYNYEDHMRVMKLIRDHSDYRGFILPVDKPVDSESKVSAEQRKRMFRPIYENEEAELFHIMNTIAKWGAGVNQGPNGTWLDSGHETLLRFIDFTFVVIGLHRGAMDDLDSHAKRFDNRIIRSSTRGNGAYKQSEKSDWYKGKILSTEEALKAADIEVPEEVTIDGITYVKTANGYTRKDLASNGDALRGNYPLAIPMDATLKINMVDLRHVYMRRNIYTHASPELQQGIESLADQIERALPGALGKLIRYDYVYNKDTNVCELYHVMSIRKTTDFERLERSWANG